jgi:exonuclease III
MSTGTVVEAKEKRKFRMRVVSWNMRRATRTSPAWKILTELKPDLALLQEVSGIPADVGQSFDVKFKNAVTKTGTPQRFGTAILVKGAIVGELPLSSAYDWVNQEIKRFAGNIVSCTVATAQYPRLNVVSVYSPAWPINTSAYPIADVTAVKLIHNPRVWGTEILWSVLGKADLADAPWIVGGDFNISETFDTEWQGRNGVRFGIRSSGNREILDRMQVLGFTECLRQHNGRLVPTFKHSRRDIAHQIDHLFVTGPLASLLGCCVVGDQLDVFLNSVSDHLPIISDFRSV